jgi:SAM-dependent methyltransferase
MAICEIGGGANPLFSRDERERLRLTYTLIDIDATELAKAPDDLHKIALDITSRPLLGQFDIIVSKHLAEHVTDPEAMHRHIRAMLRPGGIAIHFFPTLYSAPFMLNRLIPERLAERILLHLQPFRAKGGNQRKFPAYYRWCRGPTRYQIRRLVRTGLDVEEYIASFGHAYYVRASVLQRLEDAKTRFLLRHPSALLTSYAVVVLRRPG